MSTLNPEGAYLCGKIFFEMLNDYAVEAVGGYSIGADPIVTAIAIVSHLENRPLPAFIIRKNVKEHGTGKALEGNFPENGRVALFDDVVTSGGSILRGVHLVEAAGAQVAVIMAVVDREEGGQEAIESTGYPFLSIFRKRDFFP
jgi:orotate phosphoribosyltransferase